MQLYSYRNTEAGIARISKERKLKMNIDIAKAAEAKRKADEEARMRAEIQRELEKLNERIFADIAPNLHMFKRIEGMALRIFRISRTQLYSAQKWKDVVMARQFIEYWTARRTTLSLPVIAKKMGGIDHTTVLHGARVYPEKRAKMGRTLRRVR